MSQQIAPQPAVQLRTAHRYEVHGYGGNVNVEARLTQHGHCSHVTWEPGPPAWRMHYDTALTLKEIESTVQDLLRRYDLKFYEMD